MTRFVLVISLVAAFSLAAPAQVNNGDTPASTPHALRVVLLGAGAGPPVNLHRYGPSVLVEAGGDRLLFDCGRGALLRLKQADIPLDQVYKVFLTHLHSDHIVDLPDLLLTPWSALTARQKPLEVWGPAGTQSMMNYMQKAFAYDIHIRRDVDEHFSAEGIRVLSHDIKQGTVYDRNGVKVTAFLVDHGPVKPAFGYRVDYAGHSVVLSGDTRPSDNLVRFSQGTDVILHEVLDADELRSRATHQTEQQRARIIAHHSTPEEAGTIFTRVKPKLAVYYHNIGTKQILDKTRKTYSGPLEMGEDLMTITIADEVTVHHPASPE